MSDRNWCERIRRTALPLVVAVVLSVPLTGTAAPLETSFSPPTEAVPSPSPESPVPAPRPRKALFFPVEVSPPASPVQREVPKAIPIWAAGALKRARVMGAAVYDRSSPVIKDAVKAGRLTDDQAWGIPTPETLPLLAREYGADVAVRSVLTEYRPNRAASTASLTLTLEVTDLSGGPTRTMTVTGNSRPSGVDRSETAVAREAAEDAALKTAAWIAGMTPEALQTAMPKRKRFNPLATVGGIVAGAVFHIVALPILFLLGITNP